MNWFVPRSSVCHISKINCYNFLGNIVNHLSISTNKFISCFLLIEASWFDIIKNKVCVRDSAIHAVIALVI